MTKEPNYEKALEIANDTRKFEIELFWKRAGFFWLFIVSAFVGYSYFLLVDIRKALFVANFGLISSFIWILVNKGSRFWQRNWEEHINYLESNAIGYKLFNVKPTEEEKGFLGAKRFSPSRLLIGLSYYIFLAWVVIYLVQLGVVTKSLILKDYSLTDFMILIDFLSLVITIIFMKWIYKETKEHK